MLPLVSPRSSLGTPARRFACLPRLEELEPRIVLSGPEVFTVNSTADLPAVSPGSGTALTSAGTITLRSALMEASTNREQTTINLPAGTYSLTSNSDPRSGASGSLTIGGNAGIVIIQGAGADQTII